MKLNTVGYNYIGQLDVDEIASLALQEDFTKQTVRSEDNEANPQRDTSSVIGLYDMFDDIDGIYEPSVMDKYDKFIPIISKLLEEHYSYEFIQLKSFMFTLLKSGTEIYPHTDDEAGTINTSISYTHRVHIPLQTNDKAIFTVGGEDRQMGYGEVIEIDNLKEHSVVNNGDTDRIHLVIDFYGLENYYDKTLSPTPNTFIKE